MSELLDAIKHNRKTLMLILGGIFIIASFEHIESVLFFTLGIAIIAVDIIIESESKSNQTPMMGGGMGASCHAPKDIFSAVGTEDIFSTGVGMGVSCHTPKDIFSAVGTEDIFSTGVGIKKESDIEKSKNKVNTTKEIKKEDKWHGGTIEGNIVSTRDFGVDVINNYENEDVRCDFAEEYGLDPKNVYIFHFKWAMGSNFLGWLERGLAVGIVPTNLDYTNYDSSLIYKHSLVKCHKKGYELDKFKYADVYKLFYYKDCALVVINDDALADNYQVVKFSIE